MGNGYLASASQLTSIANQEIVPTKEAGWAGGYRLYKFSFDNEENCTVIINKSTTVFLKAGQGFEMERGDAPILSFVIVTSGVNFSWLGAY